VSTSRLETRIAQGVEPLERTVLAIGGDIARAVIGARRLHHVVALGDPQDNVAAMGVEGVADEAGRVGIERISDRLAELAGEKLGDLVLETFACLVGEGKGVRIRAGAKDMRVDEFDRVFGLRILRARAARENDPNQRQADEPKREKTALRQTPPTERR
jgi:hypothetical protein